jgi:hypothetical protein
MRTAFQWLSVLMFALVALQPLIGGWVLYRDRGVLDLHAMIANTTFLIAVLLVALSLTSGFNHRSWIAGWSIALVVMITAQMGLGYGAEGRPTIAALHIPVGVFIFGTSLLLMLFAFGFTLKRERV